MDGLSIELALPLPLEVLNTPEFGAYVQRIRARFSAQADLPGADVRGAGLG
jgi:hypothetical protein